MRFERPRTLPLPLHDAPRYSPNGVRLERPITAPLIIDDTELETRDISFEPRAKRTRAKDEEASPSQETHVLHSTNVAPKPPLASRTLGQTIADDTAALAEYYIIDKAIAVGGGSIVYRAAAPKSEKSPPNFFALKVLRPELRNEQKATRRLYREFRHTAKLIHPNIVRVFTIEHRSDVLFMSMELLEGGTLAAALENFQARPISVTDTLSILKQCAAALAYAHEQGIVHADFKPSNVWLDDSKHVHVIDFGSAHSIEYGSVADVEKDEAPASRMATPAYSSSQILSGAAPTPADDVFSLACVAYELLVGRPDFAHMSAAERATARTYLRRPDSISEPTWQAIQRGMQSRSEERTASVRQLLIELEESLSATLSVESTNSIVSEYVSEPKPNTSSNEESRFDIKPWQAAAVIAVLWLIGFLWVNRDGVRTPLVERTNAITQNSSPEPSTPAVASYSTTAPTVEQRSDSTSLPELDILANARVMPSLDAYLVADSLSAANEDKASFRQFTIAANSSAVSKPQTQRIVKPKSFISFDRAALNVSERAVAAVLLIQRTGSTRDPMNVKWRAVDGTAKHGSDYTGATSGTMRFTNNQAVRMLYVPLKEHEGAARQRTFEVQLFQPSSGNAIGEVAAAAVTIQKD